jgi:hypothetical protein
MENSEFSFQERTSLLNKIQSQNQIAKQSIDSSGNAVYKMDLEGMGRNTSNLLKHPGDLDRAGVSVI